jgi:crotonobetainyl-CoA:carnitine CoA-transferase CaiB-like acyl-CoA transferase
MGPLNGVKVLDITRLLPGGFCSHLLSEFGAEVIKVEEPGKGDYMRATPPTQDGVSLVHTMVNRNKRSIAIDLKRDQGKEVLRRLVRRSDVFLEGFRPGAAGRLGFSFEDVRRLNSKIVYCSISAFGRSSPLSQMPGHDINFEAMSGVLGSVGVPRIPFVQLGDYAGAFYATVGILAALSDRKRRATFIDVPIVQSLMSLLVLPASSFFATGEPPSIAGSLLLGSEPCYNLYRTSDGRHLAVAAIEPVFWKNLLAVMGLSELEEARDGTKAQRSALKRRMQRVFASKTLDEWSALLMGRETCVTPVLDIREALESAWARSSGSVGTIGKRAVLNQPLRFPGMAPDRDAPSIGEQTGAILRELGYGPARIASLLEAGAVS